MKIHDTEAAKKMLDVSVIIPTYNRASFLSLALQTVFQQTYAPYEVIVVDDGSTDGTAELIRTSWPTVRYFRHDHNLGVSTARNRGLREARGDLIAWLDADDVWEPNFLETVIVPLEANPVVDGVYSGYYLIDAAGQIHPPARVRAIEPDELYASLLAGNHIQTSAIVMRRHCFEQVGLFDTRFGISEDYDMWLSLARHFTLVSIPVPLVHYRVLEDGTQSNTDQFAQYQMGVIEKHFGPADEHPEGWPLEKRKAYAYSHRLIALRYLDEHRDDLGWEHLDRAADIWPDIVRQVDTPYELACCGQTKLERGQAHSLDLQSSERRILDWLNKLFTENKQAAAFRSEALSRAHLALAMLNDQAGDWRAARRHLRRAIAHDWHLLHTRPVRMRMLKLHLGRTLVGLARQLRSRHGKTS